MANTYNYNGEMLRPSAILKHYPNISIATMRNWLRSCDAGILYHGEQTKAYRVLSGIDADVVDFYNVVSHLTGDTSEAIDSNFDTVGTVFTFRGKVLNRRGIAYYLGVTESTISETVGSKRTLVCQWLHGIPTGEDVSELLDAHIWCRDTTILNTDVVRFYRVVHSLEGDVSRTVDLVLQERYMPSEIWYLIVLV